METTSSSWVDLLLFGNMITDLFYLAVTVFGIYFAIKALKFMKTKIRLDKEKNEKIDELIRDLNQGKD